MGEGGLVPESRGLQPGGPSLHPSNHVGAGPGAVARVRQRREWSVRCRFEINFGHLLVNTDACALLNIDIYMYAAFWILWTHVNIACRV